MATMEDDRALVAAKGVSQYFGEGESRTQVLFGNTIAVEPGQLVIMTGPSGSGKTTLLTLIGALRSVQEGELSVLGTSIKGLNGRNLTHLRRQIGFIFQLHNLFESLTAVENVLMATRILGLDDTEGRRRGVEILTRLGLGHRIDYKPKALSGGQRQRVAVARALVNRPKLILADEPTAALDKASGREVVNLLKELTVEQGSAVIMVTHDHRILDSADRVVNMVDGRIASDTMVQQAIQICEFLKMIELFSHFSPSELGGIADQMSVRKFKAGDDLIRQGEVGEEFFLLGKGRVAILIDKGAGPEEVGNLGPGKAFGERALLTGDTRAATIRGLEDGAVYVLNKDNFDAAVKASPDFRTQMQRMYFNR